MNNALRDEDDVARVGIPNGSGGGGTVILSIADVSLLLEVFAGLDGCWRGAFWL
jgi:hypothetical protein